MPQDPEYLVAHGIMQKQEQEIARLQAQVEELQGDVSRLTIENDQLKAQLEIAMAYVPPLANKPAIDDKPTMIITHGAEAFEAAKEFGQAIIDSTSETPDKPTKKSRAK